MRARVAIVFLFLNALILSIRPARADETLKKIENEIGPILKPEEAPQIYSSLQTVFDRLSQAQRQLAGEKNIQVNKIYVIDSPIIDAFVYSKKEAGISRSQNDVFITTGTIRRMFEDERGKAVSGPEDLKLGITRIAGILSHELAHPLDRIDTQGLERNYASRIASQAAEIRADSEGAEIASKAGYPTTSVYEGLKAIFRSNNISRSALNATLSTHPDNDLRLSTQRLLMTYQRLSRGTQKPRYPEAVKTNLFNELSSLNKVSKKWEFQFPQSHEEALARLENIVREIEKIPYGTANAYQTVEFNRLLLVWDLQTYLNAKQNPDSLPFSSDEFHRFVALMRSKSLPKILRKEEFASTLTEETGSGEIVKFGDHHDLLDISPAYNHPEYVRALVDYYPIEVLMNFPQEIQARSQLLSSKSFINGYQTAIESWFKSQSPNGARYFWDQAMDQLSPLAQIRMANLYHEKFAPKMSPRERFLFEVHDNNHTTYSYTIPSMDTPNMWASGKRAVGIIESRFTLMGDSRMPEEQADARKLMQSIWDRRGYYGVIDLVRSKGNYDWEAIWSVLGIDPKVGRDQLKSAVKAFTRTPEYASLIQTIAGESDKSTADVAEHGGTAISKQTPVTWADSTLWPYLAGEFNSTIKANLNLLNAAQFGVAASYLAQNPKALQPMIRTKLQARFNTWGRRPSTLAELEKAVEGVSNEIGLSATRYPNFFLFLAQLINDSSLPAQTKKNLLKELFYPDKAGPRATKVFEQDPVVFWAPEHGAEVLKILRKHGIEKSAFGITRRLVLDRKAWQTHDPNADRSNADWQRAYFKTVAGLHNDMLAEITATKTPQELLSLSQSLNPAEGLYRKDVFANRRENASIKAAFVKRAETLSPSSAQKHALFENLTATGGTNETDLYFTKNFGDLLKQAFDSHTYTQLEKALIQKRITGANLQMSIAEKLLRGRVESLTKHLPASDADLHALIGSLNKLVPDGSLLKDEWLESLAWKLHLSGPQLASFITEEKSTNWRKANPLLANLGSGLSQQLSHIKPRTRDELIKFMMNPNEGSLPQELAKEIEQGLTKEAIDRSNAFTKLEAMLREASPTEKIPLFELLLTTGSQSPLLADNFPENITRGYLKYLPDSLQEKLLLSYLRVVPPHEAAVTLSYLLSQTGQDKGSIKSMFEVFQTVGIKFGQMSSIWKLFGEQIAHETASLRDRAKPMDKAEIEAVLESTLSHQELAKIKSLDRVLGSASMKTVVEAHLQDGRSVVLLVQRPNIEAQIAGNLDLAERFVEDLRQNHVDIPAGMFQSMIANVRSQLNDEIHMTREAEAIKQAQTHYAKLNQSLGPQLKGWHFEVPGLVDGFQVRDNLLVVEKADGKAWSSLPSEVHQAVGPAIVESTLQGIFHEGWFDADRHSGNVLVNVASKTIQPIDFGQAEQFSRLAPWNSDDSYKLAQFLRYIHEQKPKEILQYAKQMSSKPNSSIANENELVKNIQKALATSNLQDQMINILHSLSNGGLELDRRFSFGALKTLMTLHGEHYISSDQLQRSLASKISETIRSKTPLLIREQARAACQRVLGALTLHP